MLKSFWFYFYSVPVLLGIFAFYQITQLPPRGHFKSALEYCKDVDNEILLIIKTLGQNYEELENWVQKTHSYDVPEIISIPIHKGLPAYLKAIDDWVGC